MENINELAAALAKAQADFKPIKKSKEGRIGNQTYKYAQLADIFDAVRKPLSDNGLSISQSIDDKSYLNDDGKKIINVFFLNTVLLHTSGQYLHSFYALPDPRDMDPKEYGKNLTYARRYSISAILGVESEDDTDGAGAESMGKGKQLAPKASAPINRQQNNKSGNNQTTNKNTQTLPPQGNLKNHAPQSRKLTKTEAGTLFKRLSDECMLTADDVSNLCKELFGANGLLGLTLVQGGQLMEMGATHGRELIELSKKEGKALVSKLASKKTEK